MEQTMEYRQQLIQEYKQAAMPLLHYLSWMEQHAGKAASSSYESSQLTEHSMGFPVYDGTLMNFVKEASQSALMDKNYRYVYSRNRIKNHKDERRLIEQAGINEWNILRGILSYYVLGGRTKGTLWSEAVQEEIFYLILKQMKSIIEYWDRPFEV